MYYGEKKSCSLVQSFFSLWKKNPYSEIQNSLSFFFSDKKKIRKREKFLWVNFFLQSLFIVSSHSLKLGVDPTFWLAVVCKNGASGPHRYSQEPLIHCPIYFAVHLVSINMAQAIGDHLHFFNQTENQASPGVKNNNSGF